MFYVGLTDSPDQRRREHGDPADWRLTPPFSSELAAWEWERRLLAQPDYTGNTGGSGWRYGYRYTITPSTTQ
jgi:hypothetical protein